MLDSTKSSKERKCASNRDIRRAFSEHCRVGDFFKLHPFIGESIRNTLWLFNITMENGLFIDGLPIKNGDFPWLC